MLLASLVACIAAVVAVVFLAGRVRQLRRDVERQSIQCAQLVILTSATDEAYCARLQELEKRIAELNRFIKTTVVS